MDRRTSLKTQNRHQIVREPFAVDPATSNGLHTPLDPHPRQYKAAAPRVKNRPLQTPTRLAAAVHPAPRH